MNVLLVPVNIHTPRDFRRDFSLVSYDTIIFQKKVSFVVCKNFGPSMSLKKVDAYNTVAKFLFWIQIV